MYTPLIPSAPKDFEMTGSENTANILMGGGSPEWGAMSKLLEDKEFLSAFHALNPGSVYDAGMVIYDHFVDSGDWCEPSAHIYADLLRAGIRTIIYSSSADPLLGPPTTEAGIGSIFAAYDSSKPEEDKVCWPHHFMC